MVLNWKMIVINYMSDSDLCYKSCGDYIVTMKKLPDTITNESRKGIVDPLHAKFRADKLLVVSIEHKSTGKCIDKIQNTTYIGRQIWYEESKKVSVSDYYQGEDEVCVPGIHYFLSRDAAFYWDNKTIRNGPFRSWYHNGQPYEEYTYLNGILHGSYHCWYDNGNTNKECSYLNGYINGSYRTWYNNGHKCMECSYLNGNMNGLYRIWYTNGHLQQECSYLDGYLNGLYRAWYKDGQMYQECTYVKGILNGLYQTWYEGGQKYHKCTYSNGQLNGLYQTWYGNGEKRLEFTYDKGNCVP